MFRVRKYVKALKSPATKTLLQTQCRCLVNGSTYVNKSQWEEKFYPKTSAEIVKDYLSGKTLTSKFVKDFRKLLNDPTFKGGGWLWYSDKQNKPYQDGESGPWGGHQQQDNKSTNPYNGPNFFLWAVGFLVLSMFLKTAGSGVPETSMPVFLRLMLNAGEVEKLKVSAKRDQVFIYLRPGAQVNGREVNRFSPDYKFTVGNIDRFHAKLEQAQRELGVPPADFVPVTYDDPTKKNISLVDVLLMGGVVLALFLLFSRKSTGSSQSMFGNPFTKHTAAKATIVSPGATNGVTFEKVAGMEGAKQEVMEFVEYLQRPQRFKELGAKMPKGALLCGDPGTGKTLLAKAVATESNVPFLSMAGSDFVEMFSGVGSARVRDLFKQAHKMAPCIVYIDEIDAIGRARQSGQGGNSEQESTLNQLLVEMDGMNSVDGVIMLASTNRPDILDRALLRPGRFDRTIEIDLPTLVERKAIFEIYLAQLKLGKKLETYSERLAELTPGKSGADIANICNEAALHAARLNETYVDSNNFEYAIERVIAGIEKKNNSLSPEERKTIAYHEAGHALVNWMLKNTSPVLKVSVVPRTSSPLGYTQKYPSPIKLHTNEQLFDIMCAHLGGRVAEAMTFGKITTGAEDDLKRVTNMAYQQIVTFGMNDRVGPISFLLKKQEEMSKKPYSDSMARLIDEEASKLIGKAFEVTTRLLEENKHKLDALANELLDKEVVNYEALVELIGEPPHQKKFPSQNISPE